MNNLKIAVILGSTRPGRNGKAIADWVMNQTTTRTTAEYHLIDLADHPLPLLDEPVPAARHQYHNEHTKTWAATIAPYDGYLFITPEYNHTIPAALKNAIDYLHQEWADKAAAFISYGTHGGTRAVEHLRTIASELHLAHIRQQLTFSMHTDFENWTHFTPDKQHEKTAPTLFHQLETWAHALKTIRT